jgi:hypothetical protein
MISRMFQISLSTSDDCLVSPFTSSAMAPSMTCPSIGTISLHTEDCFHVLAQVPGAALVARHQLQVAPGHVQAGGVAVDQFVGVFGLDAKTRLPDGHDQFHFEVVVLVSGG